MTTSDYSEIFYSDSEIDINDDCGYIDDELELTNTTLLDWEGDDYIPPDMSYNSSYLYSWVIEYVDQHALGSGTFEMDMAQHCKSKDISNVKL